MVKPEIIDERNRRWDQPFGETPLDDETVAHILSLPAFEIVKADDFPAWLPLEGIIANDGRLRRFERGEVIIRKGDYGDSLFVILEGEVGGLRSSSEDDPATPSDASSKKSWTRSFSQLFARWVFPDRTNTKVRFRTEVSLDVGV